jgi:hypothetical protein
VLQNAEGLHALPLRDTATLGLTISRRSACSGDAPKLGAIKGFAGTPTITSEAGHPGIKLLK